MVDAATGAIAKVRKPATILSGVVPTDLVVIDLVVAGSVKDGDPAGKAKATVVADQIMVNAQIVVGWFIRTIKMLYFVFAAYCSQI